MNEFWLVIAYTLLPAFGHLVGGALAESMQPPRWLVGAALHAAAGIAIALVSIDLMPRILGEISTATLVLCFLLGAVASVLLERMVHMLRSDRGDASAAAPWMIYVAVGADLVSDGVLTGAGSAIGGALGLLIAASQAIANIPGGFAAGANLRHHGVPRSRRLLMAVVMVLPVTISGALGYWLLGSASEAVKHAVLAVIVGVLLLATVEDILPEADAPAPPRWISTTAFASGFVALVLLSRSLN